MEVQSSGVAWSLPIPFTKDLLLLPLLGRKTGTRVCMGGVTQPGLPCGPSCSSPGLFARWPQNPKCHQSKQNPARTRAF